jgi:outer membrane murein-binding lipoprotein Lpp
LKFLERVSELVASLQSVVRLSLNIRTVALMSAVLLGLVAAGCSQQPNNQQLVEDLRSENRFLDDQVESLKDDVKDLEKDLEAQVRKFENAPSESESDDQYLDEREWLEGFAVAQRLRREYKRTTGNSPKIVNMARFVDTVSEDADVYWTAYEKADFRARYAAWYARNK